MIDSFMQSFLIIWLMPLTWYVSWEKILINDSSNGTSVTVNYILSDSAGELYILQIMLNLANLVA